MILQGWFSTNPREFNSVPSTVISFPDEREVNPSSHSKAKQRFQVLDCLKTRKYQSFFKTIRFR